MAETVVCPVVDLPPGTVKLVHAGSITVGVYNLGGKYCAIEDRCESKRVYRIVRLVVLSSRSPIMR